MRSSKRPEKGLQMSSKDIAIRVNSLSKCYQIYDAPRDRLKQFIMPRIRRAAGRQQKQYFREFWALQDVSFEIKKGETVGIIGRNGSGKSTLLQMICGTLTPTSGSIQTNGRIAALLELGSGFNPEFTGRENVYMSGAVLGLTRDEVDAKFDEIIAFAGIGEFIDRPVKTYSSGMYVRLAFSVAINVDPGILIVDEALAVGDVNFQAKCMQKFEAFRNKGITIILVSHDLGSILQFSDRCVLLDKGIHLNIFNPKEAVDSFKKLMISIPNPTLRNQYQISPRLLDFQNGACSSTYILNTEGCEIYGNFKVSIIDFGIFDSANVLTEQKLALCEVYSFKMKLKFHEDIKEPIFTLTIRDLTGKEIVGTNTKNELVSTGAVAQMSLVEVSFTQVLRLAPGNYLITFACSGFDGDEFVVYERLYHIILIEVYSHKKVVGYFDMEAKIDVNYI